MKNLHWVIMVIFSISLTSCDILTYLPTEDGSTSTSEPSSKPSSSDKSTSPAPKTPLPPPSKGNTETSPRSDEDSPEMEKLYKDLSLDNGQITQFKNIYSEYQAEVKDANIKYKGNQITLNKKLKALGNERDVDVKAMLSATQYDKYQQLIKAKSGKSTKGSIGG